MHELPEVETIKNELSPWVLGHSFTEIVIFDTNLVPGISTEELRHGLIGQTVESLERRGKYLIFRLESSHSLVMHLRMSGALLLNPRIIGRYARAVFHFSSGNQIVFRDPRRFGVIWLVENIDAVLSKLGPEPLSEGFDSYVLAQRLGKHHIPVKTALIEQSIIAGIGNMYADEALFAAHIHPLRKADTLSPEEIQNLHRSIQEILRSAISNKGASVDTYIRPEGQLGTAHFNFKVAHKYGELCPVCGTPIQRTLVRNRGTYFCPKCQPLSFGLLI
jgi:formamidopyrimidine-DNA glycosylase